MDTFIFQQAIDYIEAHPTEWDQHAWASRQGRHSDDGPFCGTACCLAGRVVEQAGYMFVPIRSFNKHMNFLCVNPTTGDYGEIGEVAANLLEIGVADIDDCESDIDDCESDADRLFDCVNTLQDLKNLGKEFSNR